MQVKHFFPLCDTLIIYAHTLIAVAHIRSGVGNRNMRQTRIGDTVPAVVSLIGCTRISSRCHTAFIYQCDTGQFLEADDVVRTGEEHKVHSARLNDAVIGITDVFEVLVAHADRTGCGTYLAVIPDDIEVFAETQQGEMFAVRAAVDAVLRIHSPRHAHAIPSTRLRIQRQVEVSIARYRDVVTHCKYLSRFSLCCL